MIGRGERGNDKLEGARGKGARVTNSEINYTEEKVKGMIERKKEKIDATCETGEERKGNGGRGKRSRRRQRAQGER